MARPEKEIDTEAVRKLAAMQCTNEEIAAFVGCHRNTLSNRDDIKKIIDEARLVSRAALRRIMFQSAEEGNERMQIWLSKQYLGMAERTEHLGEASQPLVVSFKEAKPPNDGG